MNWRDLPRLAVAIHLCLSAVAAETRFPGARWDTRRPAEAGVDENALATIAAALGGYGAVIKDGFLVHRWGPQADLVDWLSSAKPVLSTLLMFAIREGKVASADTPISTLGWDLKEKDRAITFRHLGAMTSGYARPDAPGAAWAYNDYAINLYQKTLFDRVFNEDPERAAIHPRRLGRLDFEDGLHFRPHNRRLYASVRDFARIAWFWLNKGQWRGEELLSRRLFEELVRPQTPADLPHTVKSETADYLNTGTYGGGSDHFTDFGAGIYGSNFWFNAKGRLHPDRTTWPSAPPDTFLSIGAGGNIAVMIPSRNIVLVSAKGAWGKLEPGDAASAFNRHITALAASVR